MTRAPTFAAALGLAGLVASFAPSTSAAQERVTADTRKSTTMGNTFIAPAGWAITVRGPATILEPPEGGSAIAFVDVHAPSADSAIAAAWQAYKPDAAWPVKTVNDKPDRNGWTGIRLYVYQTSPNEKRTVAAQTHRSGGGWMVVINDMAQDVSEKRGAQLGLIFGEMFPRGYTPESFAGKKAHPLDQARIAELRRFVETAMKSTGVPGVALGLIDHGKVVFADGFGVREMGSDRKVDANTLFLIASNTKAMTTLMLAKLVDQKRLTWDTLVTSVLPSFKLGSAETTAQVRVKHLICACTGLPRQDYEWLFQFGEWTPERALAMLGTMQPTSKFGEMFQYSNLLAAAGGFVGGHVAFPELELGAAYDRAMQTLVFGPLGMTATTFDNAAALKADHAMPHAPDIDNKVTHAVMEIDYAGTPVRPAGAAWSNVRDMLSYVSMELANGKLPDGRRYISKGPLLARRAPQVSMGRDAAYGMGLMVATRSGVTVVHHGGDIVGFHSDMMWLPEHGVGAVVLTNGDPGWLIRDQFQRKLLEVLFDGRPEADGQVASQAKAFYQRQAADRKLLTVPPDSAEAAKLASRYHNNALGDIAVTSGEGKTTFDFGEWRSDVASRKNPDGTVSFLTTVPGAIGFEFVVGSGDKRTLTVRDAQHEYVFAEVTG